MQKAYDDDQEMTMDEILASIRRYVSPEESPKVDTAKEKSPETPLKSAPLHDFLSKPTSSVSNHPIRETNEDIVRLHVPGRTSQSTQMQFKEPSVDTTIISKQETHITTADAPYLTQPYVSPTHSNQQDQTSEKTESNLDITPQQEILLSEQSTSATVSAFSKLTAAIEQTEQQKSPTAQHTISNKLTLDQVFYELARPMIRDWLDSNLPSLVESIVEKEIERITKNIRA